MITGYTDTFNRTVSNGLGTADTGQSYTLLGTASLFSVSAGVASISLATSGDKYGWVDRQTSDIDITGQVAFSAIPATNLSTAGFVAKYVNSANYYIGSLMVAAGGALSLRFSKVIANGLSTISTTAVSSLGTYVAGTYYNLRYQCYWSNLLQTNILNLKVWAANTSEPLAWQATTTDNGLTQYTAGTGAGIHGRDEATTPGSVTTRYKSVSTRSYGLPMPAPSDPMCNDPAVAYPDQTALQSLAVAADAAMVTLDPYATLAGSFPRVRISANNVSYNTNNQSVWTFDTTEFNVGTSTNLGYDNTAIYLPVGLWLVLAEYRLAPAGSNQLYMYFNSSPSYGNQEASVRSNAAQGSSGVGGTGHLSALAANTNANSPLTITVSFGSFLAQGTYTITYAALSAIKISDYFV